MSRRPRGRRLRPPREERRRLRTSTPSTLTTPRPSPASPRSSSTEGKVDRWKIKRTIKEEKTAVTLPDLVQKVKDADAAIAANKKAASTWFLDHYAEIDQVREARKKSQPVPAKLADAARKWDEFNDKDRELKKELSNAKDAVEREKRNVGLSVGDVENVETLKGDILEKQIEVDLTIKGQTTPYVMTLRKYDLQREGAGPRMMNRWVIQNLQKM